jgi:regulator of replication initiation timing
MKPDFQIEFSNQQQKYDYQLKELQNDNFNLQNQMDGLSQQNDKLKKKLNCFSEENQNIINENASLKLQIKDCNLISEQNITLSAENEEFKDPT